MKYKLFLVVFLITENIYFQTASAQDFWAGAAQKNINPDKDSLYMAGGKPNRPFIDVHDDLYVKAFYIENKKEDIVILTFDCIGLMYPALLEIRNNIKKELPSVNSDHIVISSTHTHAGPDVVGIWGKDFAHSGVNPSHMQKIISQSVAAIKEAVRKKEACTFEYASGSFGEEWVKNISEPTALDRQVSVLRFIDKNSKHIATLTNFACHPTIMDDATTQASADYVWGYYKYMDSIQGGVNMFLQGSIGGWVQPEGIESSFENAYYWGSSLARYVNVLLKTPNQNRGKVITFKSQIVDLPMKNPNFIALSNAGVIKRNYGSTVTTEIACFNIGDAGFATHPGETVPAMSIASKAIMRNPGPKFVLGLSQDALGYILKPEYFDRSKNIPHSEYLTSMSVGPQTMEIILRTIEQLLK